MVSTIAEYVHPHTYVERNASAAHVSRRRYVVPLPVVNPVARTITTTPSSTSSAGNKAIAAAVLVLIVFIVFIVVFVVGVAPHLRFSVAAPRAATRFVRKVRALYRVIQFNMTQRYDTINNPYIKKERW